MSEDASERPGEASYVLQHPVICPHCGVELEEVVVVRLLRSRVTFTSTLPRRGRVIACPACRKVLTAELAGFA